MGFGIAAKAPQEGALVKQDARMEFLLFPVFFLFLLSLINTGKKFSFPPALEYDATIMLTIFVPIGIINGRVATMMIYCKRGHRRLTVIKSN